MTQQIPSSGMLVELHRKGDLSTKGYLDILEKRFEEIPESVHPEDLWDLLRSERISEQTYLEADRSWEDEKSELPLKEEREPIKEVYQDRR